MKILWLHQYFATSRGWGAVRTHAFARRFVQAGHAVDVVCCAGYDDSLRPTGHEPAVIDGVRVFVSGTAYRPHMGFVRRVWSFLSFMADALGFVVRRGGAYDVVVASSGPLTLAVPALAGRWLRGLPFVFEVIDVWPDSAIAAGVLKNPVLKWLSFRLEALAYRYAAAIVTCSKGMTERVEKKLGVRREELGVGDGGRKTEDGGQKTGDGGQKTGNGGRRTEDGRRRTGDGGESSKVRECESSKVSGAPQVLTISNCCDLGEYVQEGEMRRKTRERLGVRDDQTVALYTGAMGLSNAVDDLVEAVRGTAGDERIVWWFAGGGPEERKLRAISHRGTENAEGGGRRTEDGRRKTGDGGQRTEGGDACGQDAQPRVRLFGTLPKKELIGLYLAADVNVVTFMHVPLFYENSPNKFFDGIAAGLPAIFNRTTWLEPWLKEYDCGVVCKGERPGQEMAEAIRGLADYPGRREQMGRNARRLAEEVFARDRLAEKYLEILRDVVRESP